MRRWVVLASTVIAVVVGGLAIGAPTAAQDPSAQVLNQLEARAANGDVPAKEALADLKVFAQRAGIDLGKVQAESVDESRTQGHIALNAKGMAPFWTDVHEAVQFDASYDIASYVVERRAAAMSMKGQQASTGRLAMLGFQPLSALCAARDEAGAVITDAVVDVWLGKTWVTRFGFGPDRPEFWAGDCSAVEGRIRSLLADVHADDQLGPNAHAARITVYSATMDVPRPGIKAILARDDVLLFDPQDDLLAPWAGRASHVRLASSVDAFGEFIASQVAAGAMAEPFVPGALAGPKGVQP